VLEDEAGVKRQLYNGPVKNYRDPRGTIIPIFKAGEHPNEQ
jgi:hypothetical protein